MASWVAGWLGRWGRHEASGDRGPASPKPRSGEDGLSLVEVTVVLAVIALLTSVAAPSVTLSIDMARQARAREDVQRIAEAIVAYSADNGEMMFLRDGQGTAAWDPPTTRNDSNRVELLVGDGDIPTLGAGVSTETYWTRPVDDAAVDTLSNHLIENLPGETSSRRYRNPTDVTNPTRGSKMDFVRNEHSGFKSPYAWRGSYLRSRVDSDPWGNRYAVNAAFLDPRHETGAAAIANITAGWAVSAYYRLDVFVLSAGSDEEIDTPSAQDGARAYDDDFIYLVINDSNRGKS